MKKIQKFLKLMKEAFALRSIMSIFNNDEHEIISDKGRKILDENKKI
jgi:hypothetical protein